MDKIQQYQDLAKELHKTWQVKVKVIHMVVGALGTILKALGKHLYEIGTNVRIDLLQKAGAVGNSKDPKKNP